MPFKATPGVFRSLRQIAEKKNSASGFVADPPYDPVAGIPKGAGLPAGSYKDTAEHDKPNHPTGAQTAFSVKGKK